MDLPADELAATMPVADLMPFLSYDRQICGPGIQKPPRHGHGVPGVHGPHVGVIGQGRPVGKCPPFQDLDLLDQLLRQGVPDNRTSTGWPLRVWVVWKGVIYEATQSGPPGVYHGYPVIPSATAEKARLPLRDVLGELRLRAENHGDGEAFDRWLGQEPARSVREWPRTFAW
jgi:hypothetical protein